MNRAFFRFVFLLALSALATAAGATVTVTFPDSGRYADTEGPSGSDRLDVVREIDQYLRQLGEAYLAPDQALRIEVLDIDLAGIVRRRSSGPIRVLTGKADGPSIKLRYTLESGGKVADRREETIADTYYLQRAPHPNSSDRLAYEKRMLNEWFATRFAAGKGARR